MELPIRKHQNLAEIISGSYLNSKPTSSSRINKVKLSTSRCPATLEIKDHLIDSSFSSPEDQDGLLLQIPYPQDLQWSPVNKIFEFLLDRRKRTRQSAYWVNTWRAFSRAAWSIPKCWGLLPPLAILILGLGSDKGAYISKIHTDLRPPALGPIGLLDRLPTGPTPWPSRPGRRLSRGPSTCLILFILFRPFKWSTHLSKLVKLIVSRKRCFGTWWGRSCGILSKLLDKACTLWHLHGFLFRKLSISPELHVGQVKSAATLTSERFLSKQLKDISIVDVGYLIAVYSSLVVPSRHLGISREHWWQKNLCSTSAILVLVPVLALPMDWNWTPALSAGYISGKTTLENMAYSNIMQCPTCYSIQKGTICEPVFCEFPTETWLVKS